MNVFSKFVFFLSLTYLTSTSAFASSAITPYGGLNISIQSNKYYKTSTMYEDEGTVQSNDTYFGVKGSHDLTNNFEVFYKLEVGINTDSNAARYENTDKVVGLNLSGRDQFIGLMGEFGSLTIGRKNTMLKISQGKVDLFNNLSGDIKYLFKGENRMAQTVNYLSPQVNQLQMGVTYIAKGDSKQTYQYKDPTGNKFEKDTNGFSASMTYGDVSLKKAPMYFAISYDSEVAGLDILRVSAQSKWQNLVLGGMYQRQEASKYGTTSDGYLISSGYGAEKIMLKAQYQNMKNSGNSWSVGLDYMLAVPTTLYSFYTARERDGNKNTEKFYGVGISHKF